MWQGMQYRLLSLGVLAEPYSSSMHIKPNHIIHKRTWFSLEMIEQQQYKQISINGAKVILIVLKNVKYSTVPSSVIDI